MSDLRCQRERAVPQHHHRRTTGPPAHNQGSDMTLIGSIDTQVIEMELDFGTSPVRLADLSGLHVALMIATIAASGDAVLSARLAEADLAERRRLQWRESR